jgi:ATPase family associated with various cellular activities (AAA)
MDQMEWSWNRYLDTTRECETLDKEQYHYLLYWSHYHFDTVVHGNQPNVFVDPHGGFVHNNIPYTPPTPFMWVPQGGSSYDHGWETNTPSQIYPSRELETFDHIQDFMKEAGFEASFEHEHEHDASSVPSDSVPSILVPKKKLVIDTEIKTLRDLLDIVRDHPYSPDVESNLDLKALYNIRAELEQIDQMVGMTTFKESLLDQLLYFMQGLHLNREQDFKHLVIYGPPGTGKSQVAKWIGLMYSKMGILKNGVFKKVTRNDLVAGYLGQTAIKTQKVIQECLGGCLFIDEVYSLGCGYGGGGGGGGGGDGGAGVGDSYSKECIDTLCEALSDYKDDLMVIVAGYEADVKESFFKVNQGLPSRFIWRFTVEEYTADELRRIFLQKVEFNGWTLEQGTVVDTDTTNSLVKWFTDKKAYFTHFGRDMELLFTYTKIGHGRRVYGKESELRRKLTMADLELGFQKFLKNRDTKTDREKMPDSCFGLYV